MTDHAHVDVLGDLVALDIVRNDRRLPRMNARDHAVVPLHLVDTGSVGLGNRRRAAQGLLRRLLILRSRAAGECRG
ncbi:hypothetical protein D3C83_58650 [compost metagenome]